ncbi:hypothetical protein B0T19DRAFT_207070 [Cercophora scortea]|uniref:Uncharacterized protein n=1 Tax=Cercophora scortea TaxID=314031 RepID=A0AAE0IEB3_9PEZI|nr:hypothetical protein B0T19DRAFT_207070 [Cercophora scortea]
MSTNPQRDMPTPGGSPSEANSSIQVQPDTWSNRAPSAAVTLGSSSRLPSRSRTPLSSFLQPSQPEQASREDVLIDLIAPIHADLNPGTEALHGLKRAHDGDSAYGEPSSKRDKLEEELDRLAAAAHREEAASDHDDKDVPSSSEIEPDDRQMNLAGARRVLPIRRARLQPPQLHQNQASTRSGRPSGSHGPGRPRDNGSAKPGNGGHA